MSKRNQNQLPKTIPSAVKYVNLYMKSPDNVTVGSKTYDSYNSAHLGRLKENYLCTLRIETRAAVVIE